MHRFEQLLLFLPAAPVSSGQAIFEDNAHLIDGRHNDHLAMSVLRRHGVVVAIEANQ